jgi:Arc/MetJ-type ribon-helix-helix transcriptional regulator
LGQVIETRAVSAKTSHDETVSISLPRSLGERIEARLSKSNFASKDEYVSYVLDQVLSELEELDAVSTKVDENVFSKEEQEEVEKRLADLGYM